MTPAEKLRGVICEFSYPANKSKHEYASFVAISSFQRMLGSELDCLEIKQGFVQVALSLIPGNVLRHVCFHQ